MRGAVRAGRGDLCCWGVGGPAPNRAKSSYSKSALIAAFLHPLSPSFKWSTPPGSLALSSYGTRPLRRPAAARARAEARSPPRPHPPPAFGPGPGRRPRRLRLSSTWRSYGARNRFPPPKTFRPKLRRRESPRRASRAGSELPATRTSLHRSYGGQLFSPLAIEAGAAPLCSDHGPGPARECGAALLGPQRPGSRAHTCAGLWAPASCVKAAWGLPALRNAQFSTENGTYGRLDSLNGAALSVASGATRQAPPTALPAPTRTRSRAVLLLRGCSGCVLPPGTPGGQRGLLRVKESARRASYGLGPCSGQLRQRSGRIKDHSVRRRLGVSVIFDE